MRAATVAVVSREAEVMARGNYTGCRAASSGGSGARFGGLRHMDRRRAVPGDRAVAEPHETYADELGDVEHLDPAEAGERAADPGQDGADRDEDVAPHPRAASALAGVAPRRPRRAADQERHRVEVDERRDQ